MNAHTATECTHNRIWFYACCCVRSVPRTQGWSFFSVLLKQPLVPNWSPISLKKIFKEREIHLPHLGPKSSRNVNFEKNLNNFEAIFRISTPKYIRLPTSPLQIVWWLEIFPAVLTFSLSYLFRPFSVAFNSANWIFSKVLAFDRPNQYIFAATYTAACSLKFAVVNLTRNFRAAS